MEYRDFNRISWSPEQEQIIYREWGMFYTQQQKVNIADLYYNKSLHLDPNDPKALYYRSRCQRAIAETVEAVADAEKALALDPLRQPFNLEVCGGLYEINQFEKAAHSLATFSRKFSGKKVQPFLDRIDVLRENAEDTLGDSLGYFILGNESLFDTAKSEMIREQNIDKRPLWKILKETQECDCLSVITKEEILLPPREIARRKRAFDIFNQIYMGRSWIDVLFLRALKSHRELLIPQSRLSRPFLAKVTKSKYEAVFKFMKMLHARCPVYAKRLINCPNRELKEKEIQDFLFRIQNQVRRSMYKMLHRMLILKDSGDIQKLRNFVEQVMGDYVTLKTDRVMPWKFKFMSEVYNLYGLALIEKLLDIPPRKQRTPGYGLVIILGLQQEEVAKPVEFKFGDRSTHADDFATDTITAKLKSFLARLQKRLIFAKYSIEKAYLLHEIAAINIKLTNFDKSIVVLNKCATYARKAKSHMWTFHALMMKVKTNAMMRNMEKVEEGLKECLKCARRLKSRRIISFLNLLAHVNKADLEREQKKKEERNRSLRPKSSSFSIK